MMPSQPGNKFGPPRGSKAFAGGGGIPSGPGGLTMGPGGGGGTPGTPSSFDPPGGSNPGGAGGGGLGGPSSTNITSNNTNSFASMHPSMDAASLAAFDLSEQQQGPPSIQNPEGLAKGGQPGMAAGGLVPHFEDGGKVEFAKGGGQLGRTRDFMKEKDRFREDGQSRTDENFGKEGTGDGAGEGPNPAPPVHTKVLKTVMPRC